jgi:hypothetical protein
MGTSRGHSVPPPVSPSEEPAGVPFGPTSQVTDHDTTTLQDVSTALDRLVLARTLTTGQARAVLSQLMEPRGAAPLGPPPCLTPPLSIAADGDAAGHRPWVAVLGEVGGYVGAAFVLGGCVVLGGSNWDSLARTTRLQLLGLPAVVLTLVALLIGFTTNGGWSVRPRPGILARRRLVATLATLAAVLSATAVQQVVDGPNEALAAMGTATGVSLVGYALCRTNLLHLALGVSFASTVAELISRISGNWDNTAWGLVAAGLIWVALATWRVLDERTLGELVGAATVYLGGEVLAVDRGLAAGYLVLGLVAVAGLIGYLRTRRVPLLVVGVVALATVVPEAVSHYAGGTIRVGGTLLVTGLSIVSASMLGLLLHHRTPAHRAQNDPELPASGT